MLLDLRRLVQNIFLIERRLIFLTSYSAFSVGISVVLFPCAVAKMYFGDALLGFRSLTNSVTCQFVILHLCFHFLICANLLQRTANINFLGQNLVHSEPFMSICYQSRFVSSKYRTMGLFYFWLRWELGGQRADA